MVRGYLKIDINTVVHCPTEELAKKVLTIVDKLGYKWMSGYKYTEINSWCVEKENTCYNLTQGLYGSLRYYKSQDKTIITAEEFIKLHKNNNMERYIVKKEDLIGQLEGFPIEVVQRMVDCQVEQGNNADVSVFQRNKIAIKFDGGFNWGNTKEREFYWCHVLAGNFYKNFEIYPKPNKKVYYRGDEKRGNEIIKALEELGGQNSNCLNGKCEYSYYFIGRNSVINGINSNLEWLLKQSFTETFLPELPKKETIKIGEDTYEVTEELKVALKNLKKENIYKPRVGDYVTILLANTPIKAIIVGISDSTNLTYIKVSADNGYEVNECYTTPAKINLATPEEKQEIDTILSYWDVIWNPTKYKLEQKRWRAEKLGVYYYVTKVGKVSKTIEGNYSWNNEDYQFGNYFRTEPQAKDKAEQLKKLFQ